MKHTHLRLTALVLSLLLCLGTMLPALAEGSMHQELQTTLAQAAVRFAVPWDVDYFMYQDIVWPGLLKAAPERFDLREHGVIADVRSQGEFGTCWSFAAIASCEASILSELGMTREDFVNAYGKELKLSEKHLAWFGTSHLPLLTDYPEGQYIYPGLEAQAGEGKYQRDAGVLGEDIRYVNGGELAYASGAFSAGIGPVYENEVPYLAADGTSSFDADWSLDEALRFGLSFELENSYLLPSPAQRDENGAYVYNPIGTEAIKNELLNGRAVSIAYHHDSTVSPEDKKRVMREQLIQLGYPITDEEMDLYYAIETGAVSMSELTQEQRIRMFRIALFYDKKDVLNATDEEILRLAAEKRAEQEHEEEENRKIQAEGEADEAAKAEAERLARETAEKLGFDYDQYVERLARLAAAQGQYINPATYAHYTDNPDAQAGHGVVIVGWDDNYPVENFLEGHQPAKPGAWIVRNSWGEQYGQNGYFYLSYYDQSISTPETFDFVVSDIEKRASAVDIMSYDYMQAGEVCSARMQEHTPLANVFTIEDDSVLRYISVLTADLNTSVTASVYLLNENASSPVDGVMLDTVTADILYNGFHRITLNHSFSVPAGARVSVVQTQRAKTAKGIVYTVPYTLAANRQMMEMNNLCAPDENNQIKWWSEGKIGAGESFICLDGAWTDWAEIIAALQKDEEAANCFSYDNLNIKLYAYPTEEIIGLHQFGEPVVFQGAHARICEDCGFTLVEP